MKRSYPFLIILLAGPVAMALKLLDEGQLNALKNSDLIIVGVAAGMTVVEHPNVPKDSPGVRSHGRLNVKVKRVVIPADTKVADILEVDYGYNPGHSSWKAYKDIELLYILRQKEKDTKNAITRAQALRFWSFAYRPADLDRVLELRSLLQAGADPRSLTNNIPKEVFSAR